MHQVPPTHPPTSGSTVITVMVLFDSWNIGFYWTESCLFVGQNGSEGREADIRKQCRAYLIILHYGIHAEDVFHMWGVDWCLLLLPKIEGTHTEPMHILWLRNIIQRTLSSKSKRKIAACLHHLSGHFNDLEHKIKPTHHFSAYCTRQIL